MQPTVIFAFVAAVAAAEGTASACGPEWTTDVCHADGPIRLAMLEVFKANLTSTCDDQHAQCFCQTCPKQRLNLFGLKGARICKLRRQNCVGQTIRRWGTLTGGGILNGVSGRTPGS